MDMDRDDPVCGCKTRARLSFHLKKAPVACGGTLFGLYLQKKHTRNT